MDSVRKNSNIRWGVVGATLFVLLTLGAYGPGYYTALSSHTRVGDFFQEWASARNYFEGLPIYTPQAITAWHYLQYRPDPHVGVFVRINGHPPACVLLGMPFAGMEYADAFRLWNLLSITALAAAVALIIRLERPRLRATQWLFLAALLLSNSLLQHLMMGQLGTVLLLLLVGTALADDRDRPVLAGVLLGTATALKLFPVLLFVYFAVHRKWRTIVAGLVTALAWVGASLALFGVQTYEHYLRYAAPEVLRYRDWWANYSVTGLWFKLFDGTSRQTEPLWFSPTVARVGSLVCLVVLVLLAMYVCRRGGANREASRTSLALMFVVMVLASPIVWDHYFLLLAWPLMRLENRLPTGSAARGVLRLAQLTLWLNPLLLWIYCTNSFRPTTPMEIFLFISWPFYALLAVCALCATQTLREAASTATESETTAAPSPSMQPAAS